MVVHDHSVGDSGLVFELLEAVHDHVEVLFEHDASFVSPRLERELHGFDSHSHRLFLFDFHGARAGL